MGSAARGMCLLLQKGSAPYPGCSWGAAPSPSSPSCLCRDIRLIEVTENICKRLLDYNLHKERSGSNRFAKVGAALQSLASPHTTGALNCGLFFLSSGSLASHLHMRPQKLGLGEGDTRPVPVCTPGSTLGIEQELGRERRLTGWLSSPAGHVGNL